MAVKFSNNAKTTLTANISATATTLAVADASEFPTLSGSDHTYATLETIDYDREVVKVTAISGNSLSVVRGQDNTTARTFSTGDKCELRLNAAMLDDATFSGDFNDLANKPVVGDDGLTQKNFTTTLKNKLDGIAAGANNYVLPFTDNSTNWNTAHGWGNHATQSYATTSDVTAAINNLIDSSPTALNTLNELAAALGDDANFSTTITNSIATKLPLAGGTMTGVITTSGGTSTNWNTAYSWGNHASAGYVTSSGNTIIGTDTDINTSGATVIDELNMTDGVIQSHTTRTLTLSDLGYTGATNANNYVLPFTDNSTNWNTAYGWGNHATQSYATTSDVTTAINNLIDSSPTALNTLNELAAALGDDANFSTTITNSIATKLPLTGGLMTGSLRLGDNTKALFGASSDLEIYHDGTNSEIKNNTGFLKVITNHLKFEDATNNNSYITGFLGYVFLYYNGSMKLNTSSTGVTITGTATMNSINVDSGTLYVDSTNDRVGVGLTNPSEKLTVAGNIKAQGTSPKIIIEDTNTSDSSFPAIEFKTYNAQDVRIYHNEVDSQLPVAGYGVVVDAASTNTQFPSTGTLSFCVTGEIYAGNTTLSNTNRVWHEGNFDAIKDEDNMASNSATALATQQSIKAYVDASSPSTLSHSGTTKATAVTDGVDLSGSLRVGQTSTYFPGYYTTTEGLSLRSAGELYVSRSNFAAVSLNRNSDGDILAFRRDGNGIGFLGIDNSENLFVGASANARHSYLNFTTGTQVEILPAQANGSTHDNAINLGKSDNRFKDLYLAGGAFLGGTASTNKLDHYAEGTWTPGLNVQSGTFTISSSSGKYTRIGNLIFISGKIQLSAENSSGTVQITGLPASIASGAAGIVSFYYENFSTLYAGLTGYITTNVINLREQNQTGTEDPNLTPTSLLEFSGQYQV